MADATLGERVVVGLETRFAGRTAVAGGLGAIGAVALLALLICWRVGSRGWDDGAITLAFSRTFALTGRVAITPFSEQVEGFSTPSWFLINAAVAKLGLGMSQAITAAQALAGICSALSVAALADLGRRLHLRSGTVLATIWTFALAGPIAAEIANGMEMALLTLCGLLLVRSLYFAPNRALAVLAAAVFLTTRFEACFYYAFILAPLLARRRFRTFVFMAAFGLAVFLGQEAWRLWAFGDWMPNTIRAKMHPPYSDPDPTSAITSRLIAAFEVFASCAPFAGAILILGIARAGKSAEASAAVPWLVLAMPFIGVEAFALISGRNIMGPVGRMQLAGLPFLLLLLAAAFDRLTVGLPGSSRRILLLLCTIVGVFVSWSLSARPTLLFLAAPTADPQSAVTVENVATAGRAADGLRQVFGEGRLTEVVPDIGGAALCCDRLRIVDLAGLANREIARNGYGRLGAILRAERPDIIETHTPWTGLSGIRWLPDFDRQFVPVLFDGKTLFVRDDHIPALTRAGARWCPVADERCRDKIGVLQWRSGSLADQATFFHQGGFFELPPQH